MDDPGWCVINSKLIGQYTYRIISTVASLFLSVQNVFHEDCKLNQGCIFFCLTPPRGQWAKIWPNIILGEKNE